jgi:hypothetical protein
MEGGRRRNLEGDIMTMTVSISRYIARGIGMEVGKEEGGVTVTVAE